MTEHLTLRVYVTSAVVMFCLVVATSAYSRNDSIRLMDDMLRNYNRKHRPILNQSEPVRVNLSIDVVSIQDFDELKGVFSLVVIAYAHWYDETIYWDPASYGGITSQIYDVEDIWYPLLVIGTSSTIFKDIFEDWMTLRIYSSGFVEFTPGLFIRSICRSDVKYFPFDKQTCSISFSPWSDFSGEVFLQSSHTQAMRNFYTENGEWSLIDTTTRQVISVSTHFMLDLVIQRKPLYAVINTILPIVLMSTLNLLVFIIPVESGERVSYTMTVLLALAVFLTLVAESLPKTSEPMSLLSFFLMTNLICSSLICIGTIWTVQIFFRKETQEIPKWQRRLVQILRCKKTTIEPSEEPNDAVKCIKGDKTNEKDGHCEEGCFGLTETLRENELRLTWQDVALLLDKCLFFIFGLFNLINTVTFMIFITSTR